MFKTDEEKQFDIVEDVEFNGATGTMNGPKTDFLCASSSLLMGFGSVINIGGHLYDYNESENPDTIAIANDWRIIGNDIRVALDQAALEKAEQEIPQTAR